MFSNLWRKKSTTTVEATPLDAYLGSGIDKVEGWLLKDAVDLLLLLDSAQKRLQVTGNLGEIGVWQGKLLVLFCLLADSAEEVLGVDSFIHCTPPQLCEERLTANMSAHAPEFNGLVLIKKDSKLLSPNDLRRNGQGFRLFDVDGDHSSEGAYSDLALAAQVINPGGIILIDDFFNDTCPGVSEGICRYFFENPDSNLSPFAISGNKIFVTTHDHYDAYCSVVSEQVQSNEQALFQKARNFHQLHDSLGVTIKLFGRQVFVLNSN
jgi:hypothetical protein